jgi:hypothetical protein
MATKKLKNSKNLRFSTINRLRTLFYPATATQDKKIIISLNSYFKRN